MKLFGVLFEGDTEFGHYRVTDTIYCGRPARVLYSGNNDAAQSGVARDDNDELLFDYNQRFLELVRGVKPGSVLVLGGGAFTLPTALMHEFPKLALDVVELDGGLLAIARDYFDFKPTRQTHVYIQDARAFVEATDKTYDLIIVDVFSHATIPGDFQTIAFAQALRKCLNKNGVAAMNIIASLDGARSMLLHRLYEVMQTTFLHTQIFPANRRLSSWTPQNYIMTGHNVSWEIRAFLRYDPIEPPRIEG